MKKFATILFSILSILSGLWMLFIEFPILINSYREQSRQFPLLILVTPFIFLIYGLVGVSLVFFKKHGSLKYIGGGILFIIAIRVFGTIFWNYFSHIAISL